MMKFEVACEDGQFAGDLARDFSRFARWVQGKRIDPDGAKTLPYLHLLQLFMENAEGMLAFLQARCPRGISK